MFLLGKSISVEKMLQREKTNQIWKLTLNYFCTSRKRNFNHHPICQQWNVQGLWELVHLLEVKTSGDSLLYQSTLSSRNLFRSEGSFSSSDAVNNSPTQQLQVAPMDCTSLFFLFKSSLTLQQELGAALPALQ